MRRVRKLVLLVAVIPALILPVGTASAASVGYDLVGIEYAATPTQGSSAGAGISTTKDDVGKWTAVVNHTTFDATTGDANITGGLFMLDGKKRDYNGSITGGLIDRLTTSCLMETFHGSGTFTFAGGTGSFDLLLTHFRYRTRSGQCLTYLATVRGTATFVDGPPSASTWYVSPTGGDTTPCSAHTSPSNPFRTITFALGCAVDGDTISVAAGTYAERLNISKSVTLTGAGPSATTVDGGTAGRVVTVGGGVSVTIANLKVTHGSGPNGAGIGNTGTLALSNLLVTVNSGVGVEIDAGTASLSNVGVTGNTSHGVLVGGESGAPSAALTLGDAASQVNNNGGGGVVVNPTGSLALNVTVAGTSVSRLAITFNGLDGLLIRGAASASGFEAGSNAQSGVVIDTGQAVTLTNFELDHNGAAGLFVRRADGTQFVTQGDRPTLRSMSLIHDNSGNGVTIGDAASPANINVTVGNADIFGNQIGLSVEHQGGHVIQLALVQNDVYTNSQNGLYIRPAQVTFSGNHVHDNALNQVVFDGGGGFNFSMDSGSGFNDATSNAVYCYTAKLVFGIFAQNASNVTVRHTEFEGGGTGLKDFGTQAGSTISVSQNGTAVTVCP